MNETSIPCPVCKASIAVNFQQLLTGTPFKCKGCESEISLGDQSKTNKADKKVDDLKK
jgi:transposase-like protein